MKPMPTQAADDKRFSFGKTAPLRRLRLLSLFSMLLCLCLSGCAQPAKVVAHQPELEVQYPPKIYLANQREAGGLTLWFYHCRPQFKVDAQMADSGTQATITIRGVTMEIGLSIRELLPANPSKAVLEHEQGHIEICRRIYAQAPTIAREASQTMIGKQFSGGGHSQQEALTAARQAAAHDLCELYSAQTARRADALSAEYDRITFHGIAKVPPAPVVDEVFREESSHEARSKRI